MATSLDGSGQQTAEIALSDHTVTQGRTPGTHFGSSGKCPRGRRYFQRDLCSLGKEGGLGEEQRWTTTRLCHRNQLMSVSVIRAGRRANAVLQTSDDSTS